MPRFLRTAGHTCRDFDKVLQRLQHRQFQTVDPFKIEAGTNMRKILKKN